jgi:hypothetical protein
MKSKFLNNSKDLTMQNLPTTQNLPIQSPPVQRGRVRRGAENVSLGGITSPLSEGEESIQVCIGAFLNDGGVTPSIGCIGDPPFEICWAQPFASDDAE